MLFAAKYNDLSIKNYDYELFDEVLYEPVDGVWLLLLHPVRHPLQQLQLVVLHPGRRVLASRLHLYIDKLAPCPCRIEGTYQHFHALRIY